MYIVVAQPSLPMTKHRWQAKDKAGLNILPVATPKATTRSRPQDRAEERNELRNLSSRRRLLCASSIVAEVETPRRARTRTASGIGPEAVDSMFRNQPFRIAQSGRTSSRAGYGFVTQTCEKVRPGMSEFALVFMVQAAHECCASRFSSWRLFSHSASPAVRRWPPAPSRSRMRRSRKLPGS